MTAATDLLRTTWASFSRIREEYSDALANPTPVPDLAEIRAAYDIAYAAHSAAQDNYDDEAAAKAIATYDAIRKNPALMTAAELRVIRHQLGHSQTTLARAIGTSKRSVVRWESGDVKVPAWVPILLEQLSRTIAR